MSEKYPIPTPEQVASLMSSTNLTWEEVPEDQVPPVAEDETVMVVKSLRLPLKMVEKVQDEADARGISWSELIRDWVAVELAALEDDQPISRADAMRALAALHPLNRRTA
ncbi:ribbon-helix-helix protein, CopG family [Nocardia sp. NPDC059239]|uniref:ribbon-helix-helix protein, CopG family n=1 Tax=Nocardia sp. NPDC059239 TaxID=3346785 RepID=UPI0036825121